MAKAAVDTKKLYPPGQTGVGAQVTVEFRRTVQFECDGRRKGPTFRKGQRYTFDEAFAQRWIRRGAAFDITGPEPDPVEEEDVVHVGGVRESFDVDVSTANAGKI